MTTFPAANYLSNSGRTAGEMKAGFEDFLAATKQLPGGGAETTLTIASGVVTPTRGGHGLDTEGAASSDVLTNIAQTNLPDGSVLVLHIVSSSRVVQVAHLAGGTGQIQLADAMDWTMRNDLQHLILKRSGTLWQEIGRGFDARPQEYSRLDYVDASTIQLAQGALPIWISTTWSVRRIPSGVTLSSAALANSTFYFVYAVASGDDVVLEASTTQPQLNDSVWTKQSDASRTLVGAVLTDGSGDFQNTATFGGVVSWYGKKHRRVELVTAGPTTSSTSDVTLGSSVHAIVWAAVDATAGVEGSSKNGTAGAETYTALHVDSVKKRERVNRHIAADYYHPSSMTARAPGSSPASLVTAQAGGKVSGGAGTWLDLQVYIEFWG